ncbi:MAG: twin-arginine translocation signal domain-containing protein, partial [Planctomycetaceae bacterium]|nr:twin-arginine translocation signal domain-containing protein [Planctomycetaceae bacterium]
MAKQDFTAAKGNGSSRRQFLKTAATAAAATTLAPCFVHAAKKSGDGEVIVGSGEYTYRCHHNWGRDSLPENHVYGGASHGAAVDSSGLIYITHYGNPGSVFVFDEAGQFVRSMGDVHIGKGHGIDIRKEGSEEFIYLSP